MLALALAACTPSPSAADLAREGCKDMEPTAPSPAATDGPTEDVADVVRDIYDEFEPNVDLLAQAAAEDDKYRPAYLAMSDFLADLTEWERHEDDPAEFERIREDLRDGLQRIGTECRIVNAEG